MSIDLEKKIIGHILKKDSQPNMEVWGVEETKQNCVMRKQYFVSNVKFC